MLFKIDNYPKKLSGTGDAGTKYLTYNNQQQNRMFLCSFFCSVGALTGRQVTC